MESVLDKGGFERATMVDLAQRILRGEVSAVARAATLIEKRAEDAASLLQILFPHTGKALVVGFAGAPGTGKSTLVDQTTRLLRSQGSSVGIIVVDLTTAHSGGGFLKARIDMMERDLDPDVFVRSVAPRGHVEAAVAEIADLTVLLDAAGTDVVLVETMGAGDAEIEVARQSEVVVLVLAPGAGEMAPTPKTSVFELADVLAVNKADQPGVYDAELELHLRRGPAHRDDGWLPPIVRTIATEARGIDELVSHIRAVHAIGGNSARQVDTWELRLGEMLRDRLLHHFPRAELCRAAHDIVERRRDPYTILEEWQGRMQISHRS